MKRSLFKFILFLIFGAIVNIAVAWGCAIWLEETSSKPLSDGVVTDCFAKRQMLEGSLKVLDAYVESGIGMRFHEMSANEVDALSSRAWLAFLDTGWPALALRAEWRAKGDESTYLLPLIQLHSGFEIKSRSGQIVGMAFGMPSRPNWPGFAINTIFYAVILWILWLSPFAARRFIRHKRGLCIKCGYDLRGTDHVGCPECGWGRGETSEQGGGDDGYL